jgi:hypothetical protein
MGRSDQGEWRFILIGVDRMRFTYPSYPYWPLSTRDALRKRSTNSGLLGFGGRWESFRMRRLVVSKEE